jgi:hypothetical protein
MQLEICWNTITCRSWNRQNRVFGVRENSYGRHGAGRRNVTERIVERIWRRGWESNPRIVVLQTTALGHLATAPLFVMPKIYAQRYAQRALFTPLSTSLTH